MSEGNNKRKWSGVLLIFIWTIILTPLALWCFHVPGNRWLGFWIFYPFFIAILAILDILIVPELIKEVKFSIPKDKKILGILFLIGVGVFHSGLYFAVTEGAKGGFVTALFLSIGVFGLGVLLAGIVIVLWIALLKLLKLFIKLHKIVLFPKKIK